jgi:hypothetical protein
MIQARNLTKQAVRIDHRALIALDGVDTAYAKPQGSPPERSV